MKRSVLDLVRTGDRSRFAATALSIDETPAEQLLEAIAAHDVVILWPEEGAFPGPRDPGT